VKKVVRLVMGTPGEPTGQTAALAVLGARMPPMTIKPAKILALKLDMMGDIA
jgi:hypothetical protein